MKISTSVVKGKEKPILWMLHSHNENACNVGRLAKDCDENPYTANTNNWYSWNRGYNESRDW